MAGLKSRPFKTDTVPLQRGRGALSRRTPCRFKFPTRPQKRVRRGHPSKGNNPVTGGGPGCRKMADGTKIAVRPRAQEISHAS